MSLRGTKQSHTIQGRHAGFAIASSHLNATRLAPRNDKDYYAFTSYSNPTFFKSSQKEGYDFSTTI